MELFKGLEKLINEHGTAVILKERIILAEDRHSTLEDKCKTLETKNQSLVFDLNQAKEEISSLKQRLPKARNTNPDGYVCDHCGCDSLKRTGNRPDPIFEDLGVKQKLFKCNECQKESAFTP
jgi:hypothetical protein